MASQLTRLETLGCRLQLELWGKLVNERKPSQGGKTEETTQVGLMSLCEP